MGIGDVIFDSMAQIVDDVLEYEHAREPRCSAIILDLLTNMHQAVSAADWGEDKCSVEQSRQFAENYWREKCHEKLE
jgi:hypothetical protein